MRIGPDNIIIDYRVESNALLEQAGEIENFINNLTMVHASKISEIEELKNKIKSLGEDCRAINSMLAVKKSEFYKLSGYLAGMLRDIKKEPGQLIN